MSPRRSHAPPRRDAPGPLFGGRPLAAVRADLDRLQSCYALWFDYVAQEASGTVPLAGAVGQTLGLIRQLERAVGRAEADRAYSAACQAHHDETGRCHRSGCGQRRPCGCPDDAA